ncbi:hypothetical protein H0I76_09095 [Limibaculum sp. M0105]|uniref:Uncharacterized protein n=1 Tax=Thermohalobaculum xanthum TaxID=2753746 RepID=A0A8J7M6P2_9RHOB|nr:cysteine rich repeat-containing protein [Thermohalobaculum xanthum]MBK0399344.1 hypothetical protein [Thermohalobaculum xanthum]
MAGYGRIAGAATLVLVAALSARADDSAGDSIVEVLNSCSTDITTHCAGVAPGGGRLLGCLAQNEAALSPRCGSALAIAPRPLEALSNSFAIVERACGDEIALACGAVEPGDGRVMACVDEKAAGMTPGCREALQGLGIAR